MTLLQKLKHFHLPRLFTQSFIVESLPILLALTLASHLKLSGGDVHALTGYGVFILLVLAWRGIRLLVLSLAQSKSHPEAPHVLSNTIKALSLLVLIVLSVISLYSLKERLNDIEFEILMLALGLDLVGATSWQKQWKWPLLLAALLAHWFIGMLSFPALGSPLQWQTLSYSGGFACALTAYLIGSVPKNQDLASGRLALTPQQIATTYGVLLLLAPTLIALLSFHGSLPKKYLLIYLTLPIATKAITVFRSEIDSQKKPRQVFQLTYLLLFIGILAFLGLQ